MNLVRARDVMGLPVVSIFSGEDIAEVRDVVYDGEDHQLIGFTLNKRGRFAGRMKAVLAAVSISAIGKDAVMVDAESAINDVAEGDADLRDLRDARPVLGNRVLSADGSDLGEVIAVILSTGDEPCAVGYELRTEGRADTAFVPISAQMALSGDNLVVPVEATDFIRNDLAGFGAAIASYRSLALEAEK